MPQKDKKILGKQVLVKAGGGGTVSRKQPIGLIDGCAEWGNFFRGGSRKGLFY